MGASTGLRLGRKAAERKTGREGSSEGQLLRGFAVPFRAVQEQSPVPLLLPYPPSYLAPFPIQSVLPSLPSHSDPAQLHTSQMSALPELLAVTTALAPLSSSPSLYPGSSAFWPGHPFSHSRTGQLYSLGTTSHSSRGYWAAGLWFFSCLSPPLQNSFSRVGP